MKLAELKNDEKEKEKSDDFDNSMRNDAAVKIQSNYRGYAVRKKFKANNSSKDYLTNQGI